MGIGRGNGSKVVKGGICDICNHDVACKVGFILLCDNCNENYLTISGLARKLQASTPIIKKSITDENNNIPKPVFIIKKSKGDAPLWSKEVIDNFVEGLELIPYKKVIWLLGSGYDMRKISKMLDRPFYILKLSLKVRVSNRAQELISRRM